jgi:GT2 family glycosyltransferase
MAEKVLKTTLEVEPFHMVPVEIIIPIHNEHAKVVRLFSDIFKTVSRNRYLITLVDDGSENKEFLLQLREKKLPGLRYLKHDKCMGFGASVNTALKDPFNSSISYVAIMHSDVILKETNWLFNLGKSLLSLRSQNVKMISPLTDNPVVDNLVLKSAHNQKKEDVVLQDGFLPMYCVLSHRELFKKVGLLKELPYAGGEAQEFAWRMRKNGFKQGVCGSSWVGHEGSASLNHYKNNQKVQQILRKNYEEVDSLIKST